MSMNACTYETKVCYQRMWADKKKYTHSHRLICRSRLHLVVCAFTLLTSSTLECVRLSLASVLCPSRHSRTGRLTCVSPTALALNKFSMAIFSFIARTVSDANSCKLDPGYASQTTDEPLSTCPQTCPAMLNLGQSRFATKDSAYPSN